MKPIWYVSGKPLQESFQRRYLLLTMSLLVAQTVKNPPASPWVGKIWRRKWQPTSVFLPGEFHEQRSLVGYSPWGQKELDTTEWLTRNWCFWTVVLEKTLGSPLDCKEIQPVHSKGVSVMGVHWKDWCWSWNSNTLATWCEELTHWKRPRCWERLRAGGEGDNRGWDGWMASPTQWTWVWVDSGWTGRPGVLRFMGSQRVRHDWTTELNWIEWLTH